MKAHNKVPFGYKSIIVREITLPREEYRISVEIYDKVPKEAKIVATLYEERAQTN